MAKVKNVCSIIVVLKREQVRFWIALSDKRSIRTRYIFDSRVSNYQDIKLSFAAQL